MRPSRNSAIMCPDEVVPILWILLPTRLVTAAGLAGLAAKSSARYIRKILILLGLCQALGRHGTGKGG